MAAKGNLITLPNGQVWSYDTMIKELLPNGHSIGNITKYSSTSSKHQTQAMTDRCNILLDNVPKGCASLSALAKERGLL